MGAKIGGIVLLIVGAGVALYFFQSGGASKFGGIFHPPTVASSTTTTGATATSSTSGGGGAGGGVVATTTKATTTPNAFITFLEELFAPPRTGPIGPGGAGSGGNSGGSGSSGGGQGNSGQGTQGATGVGLTNTSTIPASQIPAGLTAGQLSPYFHLVRFDGVGRTQIGLSPWNGSGATTTIDITGWDIKTNRSGIYVPQAVNIYNPSAAANPSDIVFTTGQFQYVYLYANSSPVNVRLNECMGYLNATNQFNPNLPRSCPSPSSSQISSFTGQCQNYIQSLGCSPADPNSPQVPRYDYACQQYLENNFTYNSCISNHATDPNFLSNIWYVWVGATPLDPYHDNVELLDKNGLVVDTYSY